MCKESYLHVFFPFVLYFVKSGFFKTLLPLSLFRQAVSKEAWIKTKSASNSIFFLSSPPFFLFALFSFSFTSVIFGLATEVEYPAF